MATSAHIIDQVATALADAGLVTYRPTGRYAATDVTPLVSGLTPASPDQVVVASTYITGLDNRTGLQLRLRTPAHGSPSELADQIRRVLHGRTDMPGIVAVFFVSGASLGQDAKGRPELTLNFHVVSDDPVTAYDA